MPDPLPTPERPNSDDGARADVLHKINFVCSRLIQGQNATQCWEMYYYRFHTVFTVLLSVLGSGGLIKKQYDLSQMQAAGTLSFWDWETVAAILSLVGAILLELFRAFGIDKKALQAMSAYDSFSRLLKALENALEDKDPRGNPDKVVLDTKTLGTNFHDVLQEPNAADVVRLQDKLVARFGANWSFPPTERKGKSR